MEFSAAHKSNLGCLICHSPTLSTHFGVVSCRACAAFFRRAVTSSRDYPCRNGRSCTLFENIRHACKKCRFVRCLQAGMKREAALRLNSGVKTGKINQQQVPSPSTSTVDCPAAFLPKAELLQKLVENYRTLCSVRKATEFALFPRRQPSTIAGMEGLSFGTSGLMSLFFRVHIPTVINFISSSFEEFTRLSDEERWQLLQPFLVYLWWYDSTYRTYKRVDQRLYTRIFGLATSVLFRYVMSETTYFDVERVDEWMSDMVVSSETVKANLREIILQKYLPEYQQLMYYFDSMQLTEEEYVATVGLLFWNAASVEHCQVTENCKKVIQIVRKKIYEALEEIYRNSTHSWSVRYGELLNLVNHILIDCLRGKEELGLLYSLDAFKKEDFFYEMNITLTGNAQPDSIR